MSVEKLVLKTVTGGELTITLDKENEFEFYVYNGEDIYTWLDRSQAHLLMLYLQEH